VGASAAASAGPSDTVGIGSTAKATGMISMLATITKLKIFPTLLDNIVPPSFLCL
jgi:hypothetical protein